MGSCSTGDCTIRVRSAHHQSIKNPGRASDSLPYHRTASSKRWSPAARTSSWPSSGIPRRPRGTAPQQRFLKRSSRRPEIAPTNDLPEPSTRPFLVIVLALALLHGCNRSPESKLTGCLYLRVSTNPTTLDPALITDVMGGGSPPRSSTASSGSMTILTSCRYRRVLEGLKRPPHLHLQLRKNAAFSSGRNVTAQDFQYSFERVLSPGTKAPITWVLDRIKGARDVIAARAPHASGIRVIDDHTLELTLEKPFGPFLSLLGMSAAYVVPREAVAQFGQDFGSHPVGSGPYVLTEWLHARTLPSPRGTTTLKAAPLKGIVYRVIPEDLTAVMEFETGGLDALQIPASEYRRYRTEPKWSSLVVGRPGLNCYYLGLNTRRAPFQDIRVRQAVNMAIDRRRLLETVFEKRGVLAAGPILRPCGSSAWAEGC